MQHDRDKINWSDLSKSKWYIYHNYTARKYECYSLFSDKIPTTYFYTEKIAEQAIKEIVIPFVEEHTEFVW